MFAPGVVLIEGIEEFTFVRDVVEGLPGANVMDDHEIDGVFVATSPPEALRLILSWAATRDAGPSSGVAAGRKDNSILIADVSRSFFEAPAKRDICVELPRRL